MYLSLTLHQCDYKKAKSQVQTKQRSWGLDAKRDEWPLTWQTVKIWIWSSLSRSKRLAAQESGKKAKEPGCNWSSKKKSQWCGLSLRLKRQVENVLAPFLVLRPPQYSESDPLLTQAKFGCGRATQNYWV